MHPVRLRADEAVAGQPLASFDRLEQERVRTARDLEVGRDRRLEVGDHVAEHRDDVSLAGHRLHFVERRAVAGHTAPVLHAVRWYGASRMFRQQTYSNGKQHVRGPTLPFAVGLCSSREHATRFNSRGIGSRSRLHAAVEVVEPQCLTDGRNRLLRGGVAGGTALRERFLYQLRAALRSARAVRGSDRAGC